MLDPALLPNYLYMCPKSEYNPLFEVLNPFYAVALLRFSYRGDSTSYTRTYLLNKDEVCLAHAFIISCNICSCLEVFKDMLI